MMIAYQDSDGNQGRLVASAAVRLTQALQKSEPERSSVGSVLIKSRPFLTNPTLPRFGFDQLIAEMRNRPRQYLNAAV